MTAPLLPPAPTSPAAGRERESGRGGHLVVATDGSCLGNPGPGGWCWFASPQSWAAGAEAATTNNRMELASVAALLDAVPAHVPLLVLADSRYVIDALTRWRFGWARRGWRTAAGAPVKNRDLIEPLHGALAGRTVAFEWVRGHVGHPLNEAADVRARACAEALAAGRPAAVGPGLAAGPDAPGRALTRPDASGVRDRS